MPIFTSEALKVLESSLDPYLAYLLPTKGIITPAHAMEAVITAASCDAKDNIDNNINTDNNNDNNNDNNKDNSNDNTNLDEPTLPPPLDPSVPEKTKTFVPTHGEETYDEITSTMAQCIANATTKVPPKSKPI